MVVKMDEAYAKSHYLDCDDIEECYEERLLKHLDFFRTKVAVPSVYRSRLNKLKTDTEAAEVLMKESLSGSIEDLDLNTIEGSIKGIFDQYYTGLNAIRSSIYRNPNLQNITRAIEYQLEFTGAFLHIIASRCQWESDDASILVGIEPDPMHVYEAIRALELKGISTLNDINLKEDNALTREIKRLLKLNEYYK